MVRRTDPLLLLAVVLAAAFFAFIYVVDPVRPGIATPEGWFGYADQSQYLEMARQLSDFGLQRDAFTYGPGYPVLAVPFLWIGLDYDPFAVVDGIAFVLVIAMAFVVGRRLGGRLVGAVSAFGLMFATPLVGFMTQPWNSTVSIVAVLAVLVVATNPKIGAWSAVVLGLAPGMAFAARYVDGLLIGSVALAVLIVRRHEFGRRGLIIAVAVGAIPVVITLVMHAAILGSPFTTPYTSHVRAEAPGVTDADLGAYDLISAPQAFFGMFISTYLLGARFGGETVLQGAFWFLLAIPGVWVACRRGRPAWIALSVAVTASLIAVAFYSSFHGAGPGSVQFGSLHYFKAWWPLWGILAACTIGWVARWRPGGDGRSGTTTSP